MNRYITVLRRIISLVAEGNLKQTWKVLRNWIHSETYNYGLYHDIHVPLPTPVSSYDLTIRPIEPEDAEIIFGQEMGKLEGMDKVVLMRRAELYERNIPTCYVAVIENNQPCFIVWLITAEHNEFIQAYFGGYFPILQANEALLELAYTFKKYRKNRIFSESLVNISELAYQTGIERVVSFVNVDNINALRSYNNAGYIPFTQGIQKWRLFRRGTTYYPLPEVGINLDIFSE